MTLKVDFIPVSLASERREKREGEKEGQGSVVTGGGALEEGLEVGELVWGREGPLQSRGRTVEQGWGVRSVGLKVRTQ